MKAEKKYFASNLKFLRQQKGMEQLELAGLLGRKSPSSISEWEKGKYTPKSGILSDIASIFNVSLSDLMETDLTACPPVLQNVSPVPSTLQKVTDTTSKLEHKRQLVVLDTAQTQLKEQTDQQNTVENSTNTVGNNVVQFPKRHSYDYYDQALSAGTGQYLNDVRVEQIELPVDIDADFVVPIYGDSMEPDYHSGDYVFVKLSVDLIDGDIGVFEYYGDAYIKQLVINNSGAFLHSLNKNYDDIPIDTDSDFRIIGEVVGKYSEK